MVRRSLLLAAVVIAAFAFGCKKKKTATNTPSGSAPVASGSAPDEKFAAEWNIVAADGVCSANEHGKCPPDTECTPEPPRAIECPPGAEAGGVRVVELADKSCAIMPSKAKTPCPLPKGEALPPLSWAVTAAADGTCVASWSSPATGAQTLTIKCPIADVASMTIKRVKADAPCIAEAGEKKIETKCPAAPKEMTITALREAVTKDAAAMANERVSVQAFYVKSMVAQTSSGKVTTFILGAAETKGDAKTAIRCTSLSPLGEAPDGDPIIVEGSPKKSPDGIALTECRASKP